MPRSSREKTVETRARIIDAAHRIFVERGYHATSMRDISTRAGVTVGAIYNHFATKEDIWVGVLREHHPYREVIPLLVSAEGETVAEMIRSAARLMISGLQVRKDVFNLLFIEIVEHEGRHVQLLFADIVPLLAELQSSFLSKKGRVRDLPDVILLRSFVGLFFSFYVTGVILNSMGGNMLDEQSLDQFVDLYLHGVLQEEKA
jgi:AcrR family transcriptional regulator